MISFLYSTVGFVIAISYIPQVLCLVRAKTHCSDISLTSWWIWNYTSIVSMLYGIYGLQDLKMSLTSAIIVFFVNLIIGITIYKRIKYKDIDAVQ